MSYNPKPTRVWSRVQNPCTFVNDSFSNNKVFVPLTGKTVSQFEADYQKQLYYKGNVLQYKKNSSSITKSQKYSQICKGAWTRIKSYATQSDTYTNPNIFNLQQVNYVSVPTNGNTRYIPGPVNFNIPAPYGCTNNIIKEGGSLIPNTVVNPCTNEIIKQTVIRDTICSPTYCSDVPGKIQDLCWNSKLETWYPRQRYIMPTSGTKWPEGYKGFVSAVDPEKCRTSIISNTNNLVVNNVVTNNAVTNNDVTNNDIANTTVSNTLTYNNINPNSNSNSNNNTMQNLVNYHIIEGTNNENNPIELSNYLNDVNNTVVTFDNKTANVIQIISPYLIFNEFFYQDGTKIIDLYSNQAISIYYFTYNPSLNTIPTLKAIIF